MYRASGSSEKIKAQNDRGGGGVLKSRQNGRLSGVAALAALA